MKKERRSVRRKRHDKKRLPCLKQQLRGDIIKGSVIGLAVSMIVSMFVLMYLSRDNAERNLDDALSYCCEKLDDYTLLQDHVLVQYQQEMYRKAKAVRDYVALNPEVVKDKKTFISFCEAQDLDEVCVINADGIVVASHPWIYVGEDLKLYPETRKYMKLLEHENLVIVENAREDQGENSSNQKMEYVGVARKDEKGIIEVAQYTEDAMKNRMNISLKGIAENFTVGRGGGVLITESGYIVGAKYAAYNGGSVQQIFNDPDAESFREELFGQYVYVKRRAYGNYVLYAYIDVQEVVGNSLLAGLIIFFGLSVSFIVMYLVMVRVIDRDVVNGIEETNHLINQVTAGDFSVYASIRHNQEFDHLSNGLNQMLKALRLSRKQQDEQLEEMTKEATHDLMTGLLNRNELQRRIDEFMEGSGGKEPGAAVLLDMDYFKEINDTYGHPVGDLVLIYFAEEISRRFGEGAYVGRLGGDEFLVFLPGKKADTELTAVLDDLLCEIGKTREFDANPIGLSCSIGVAGYPEHGTTRVEIYHSADVALYYAKKHGKGCYCIYRPRMKN